MKVVLATGFIPKIRGKSSIRQGLYPPLGLGYVAAALGREGHQVAICDCLPLHYSVREIVDSLLGQKPDIVGVGKPGIT